MMPSSYFNDQTPLETNEINDKVVDWLLPPKFELSDLAEAKVFP